MDRRILLALAVLPLALAGCLGDDPGLDEQSADAAPDPAEAVGHAAQVHGLPTDPNATGVAPDPREALPEDVPVPGGLGRVVPGNLFEPTIGVTSDGAIFVSNSGKGEPSEETPPDTKYSSILRSTDGGKTWEDVTDNVGPVSVPPNTYDPYVYVDPATDRVYNMDMIGLQCNWVRWSDDAGDSWTNNPAGCGQPPFQDHPTIWTGPPTELGTRGYENVVYLCVNRLADSACAVSLDGGLTWSPWRPVSPGLEADEPAPSNASVGFCGGLHAHGVSGPDGTAYLPKGQCGDPTVYVTRDNGLTWTEHTITTDVPTIGHEVALATDAAGNVYAHWVSPDHQSYLAYSTDRGETWSDPVVANPPDVNMTSHPTIAAGAEGRLALAYIGTTHEAEAYEDVTENATWNGYVTTIVGATSEDPAAFTTTANDPAHPIGMGVCGGTRCRAQDDAGVGDFIDVTIDDEGRPWAAFVDVCLEKCEKKGEPVRKEGRGLVGTLAQGPSLRGPLEALPTLEVGAQAGARAGAS